MSVRPPRVKSKPWNGKTPRKTFPLSDAASDLLKAMLANAVTVVHNCASGSPWNSIGIVDGDGNIESGQVVVRFVHELYFQGYVMFKLPRLLNTIDQATYEVTKLGAALLKSPVPRPRKCAHVVRATENELQA